MRYAIALFAIYVFVSLTLRTTNRPRPTPVPSIAQQEPQPNPADNPSTPAPSVPMAEKEAVCLRCALNEVVFIKTETGFGSGVVVRADGWIVTNFHVVQGSSAAEVKLRDGRVFPVTGFWKADPDLDSVFLKIEAQELIPAKWPNASFAETDQVFSMGAPQGLSWTATDGIISRILPIAGSPSSLIQHTADIAPGSSGGALLNARAELIGLNTLRNKAMARTYYAVSADHLRQLMAGLPDGTEATSLRELPSPAGRSGAISPLLDRTISEHTEQ